GSPGTLFKGVTIATAEYLSPGIEKTGAAKKDLLTNHKPEPNVRHRPSESTTLAAQLITHRFIYMSVSDWLHVFLACHWNTKAQRIGPICLRPHPSPKYAAIFLTVNNLYFLLL
uniref:Ovule protein n=1 Tax=Mesocestoides corti TaxID=53468 RepID=A0A5K3FE38_MESCO